MGTARYEKKDEFPDGFLFGVANADHQVEGFVEGMADAWDAWEESQGLTKRGSGTDFWNRYEEDLDLAAGMGCSLFRFSISWARVEPEPGVFNEEAIEHYRKVIEAIHRRGMRVMTTLVHFTWPIWVEKAGGIAGEDFVPSFERYARKMGESLGEEVDYWISFNEPSQLVYGFIKPWWEQRYYLPPGLPRYADSEVQSEAVERVIWNLFLAHARARTALKENRPDAKVGVNPLMTGFPPWLQELMDWQSVRSGTASAVRSMGTRAPLVSEQVEVDLVIGGTHPSESEDCDFSNPYLETGKAVMIREDDDFRSVEDIFGKRVGVLSGTNSRSEMKRIYPELRPTEYPDYLIARQALKTGKVDALFGDEVLMSPLGWNPQGFRILKSGLTRDEHAVAAPVGHEGLLKLVNEVVADFQCQWFGNCAVDDSLSARPADPHLSLAEYFDHKEDGRAKFHSASKGKGVRRIKRRGSIRIGVRRDAYGCEAGEVPDDHALGGIEIELAEQISEAIFGERGRVEFLVLNPADRLKMLQSRWHWLNRAWQFLGTAALIGNANWWYLGCEGRLSEEICPSEAIGALDFVGVDYYWGLSTWRLKEVERLGHAAGGRFLQAPVWAKGLYHVLMRLGTAFPDKEIIIVENGSVPLADGVTRVQYQEQHLAAVSQAIRDGAFVTGYLCWSITSNREWGHPFSPNTDFGLYFIDLDNDPDLIRHETDSAKWYRNFIQSRQGKLEQALIPQTF